MSLVAKGEGERARHPLNLSDVHAVNTTHQLQGPVKGCEACPVLTEGCEAGVEGRRGRRRIGLSSIKMLSLPTI